MPAPSTRCHQTVTILAQELQQFETLLQSLDNLSTQGRSHPRDLLPPDRDPVADAAGGERPARRSTRPIWPGSSPRYRPADNEPSGGAWGLRAALTRTSSCAASRAEVRRQHAPAFACRAAAAAGRSGRHDQPPPRRQSRRLLRGEFRPRRLRRRQPPRATRCRAPPCSPRTSPTRPGLPGFEVELNGVPVGTVRRHRPHQGGHHGHHGHPPGHKVPDDVHSSVQIANDLGEQVVDLVPARGGDGARLAPAPRSPVAPEPDPGQRRPGRRRRHPPAPGHPGREPQQADRRAGRPRFRARPGTCAPSSAPAPRSPRSSWPTRSSSPRCWPTPPPRSTRSPRWRPSCARTWSTRRRSSRCWRAEDRVCTLCCTSGSSAFSAVNQLVTSQSANLGCILHDTAAILSNLAQPTNLTNLSQGLAEQPVFLRRDSGAGSGWPRRPRAGGADNRTRSSCAPPARDPAHTRRRRIDLRRRERHTRHPSRCRVRHGLRQRRRAGHPSRFHARRRGSRGCATAQEADVEVASATPVGQVSSASYHVPADRSGLLLTLGGLVVPALFLAWGARPARRRTRRRA